MIRIGAANYLEDLTVLAEAGAAEVLLGSSDLSRYGTIPQDQLIQFAQTAKKLGLRAVLEWDILMTQPEFDKAAAILKDLPMGEFGAIRVQDPGAFEWVLKNFPALKIQLNLETGNHNLKGVLAWCCYGGKNLDRVMLSSQLPASTLRDWIKKIPVGVEVLGLGPVLILYTPRHLLTNQLPETAAAEHFRATASSEESFHSGFRVLENKHGTLVFLGKDYCLMELIEEIETLGLGALRIDLRLNEVPDVLNQFKRLFRVSQNFEAADLLEKYPIATTRCFYKSNSTDKAFARLKNENLLRRDEDRYIGEVVESVKGSHLIVWVRARSPKLRAKGSLLLISPQGEKHEMTPAWLRDLESRDITEAGQGDFAVIPYVRFFPTKSLVYGR